MFIFDSVVWVLRLLADWIKQVYNYIWTAVKRWTLKKLLEDAKHATDKDFKELSDDHADFARKYADYVKSQRDE